MHDLFVSKVLAVSVAVWVFAIACSAFVVEDWNLFFRQLLQVGLYIIFLVGLSRVISDDGANRQSALWGLWIGALCLSLVSDLQIATSQLAPRVTGWAPNLGLGLEPTINHISFWAVIGLLVIPLALWPSATRRVHAVLVVGALSSWWTLSLTETRAAVVVGAVAGIVVLLLQRPRFLLVAVSATAAVLSVSAGLRDDVDQWISHELNTFSSLERILLVESSVRLYAESPLVGHGLGSTTDLFLNDYADVPTAIAYPHPHNVYAQYAVELGTIGLISLMLLIGGSLITALLFRVRGAGSRWLGAFAAAAIAAVAVQGLSEDLLYNSKLGYLGLSVIAFGFSLAAAPGRLGEVAAVADNPRSRRLHVASGSQRFLATDSIELVPSVPPRAHD